MVSGRVALIAAEDAAIRAKEEAESESFDFLIPGTERLDGYPLSLGDLMPPPEREPRSTRLRFGSLPIDACFGKRKWD